MMLRRKRSGMATLFVGGGLNTTKPTSPDSFDPSRSPTSPLDHHMVFANLTTNPLVLSPRSPRAVDSPRKSWDGERVGLGLVDTLVDSTRSIVVFGSQMRSGRAPKSHHEGNSNDAFQTMPCPSDINDFMHNVSGSLPLMLGSLPASNVEMSEDYTRITTHGPNPKTTHIFGDCVLEGRPSGGLHDFGLKVGEGSCSTTTTSWMVKCAEEDPFPSMVSGDFLSSCYSCRKKLGDGEDIYMYRGEKAFCSCECRHREISMEEDKEEDAMVSPNLSDSNISEP